jgi:hypothetical protein
MTRITKKRENRRKKILGIIRLKKRPKVPALKAKRLKYELKLSRKVQDEVALTNKGKIN